MESIANIGWTNEARVASLEVRRARAAVRAAGRAPARAVDPERAKAAERAAESRRADKAMFDGQREQAGADFRGYWYPRGRDGLKKSPYIGETSAKAPYGFYEGTTRPRKEPLYDEKGRAILPRPPGHSKSVEADLGWLAQGDALAKEWGPFGRRMKFMRAHPGASQEDWAKHDREQYDAYKKRKAREEEGWSDWYRQEAAARRRLTPAGYAAWRKRKGVEFTDPAPGTYEDVKGSDFENRAGAPGVGEVGMVAEVGGKGEAGGGVLILNRETFSMPSDGWYQIAPLGEFAHAGCGVVQIVDGAACEAMASRFREDATAANFAGLLIDFDHFSLDGGKRSEAAGWITALDARVHGSRFGVAGSERDATTSLRRPEGYGGQEHAKSAKGGDEGGGLWGKIRWSDLGEEAVRGGRYRFLSPVWSRADCQVLGTDAESGQERLRPVRLLNAAVTNDPNLKGMVPLSNRAGETVSGDRLSVTGGDRVIGDRLSVSGDPLANADVEARLKWELGDGDRHCPSCAALAGQVRSKKDWEKAGLKPGAGVLICQGHCHCSLVATDEAATENPGNAPLRKAANRAAADETGGGDDGDSGGVLANVGWQPAARLVSLAVRRAKAALRGAESAAGPEEPPPPSRWVYDPRTRRMRQLPPQPTDPRLPTGPDVPRWRAPGWIAPPDYRAARAVGDARAAIAREKRRRREAQLRGAR